MIITVMTSTLPIGGHGPPWSFKQILKATGIGWHVWSKTFPRKLMRKCWQISSLQFLQLGPCSTSKLWGQLGQLSIHLKSKVFTYPIGSIYGIYTDIGGILMVNVTTYCIHGSYGYRHTKDNFEFLLDVSVQQWPEPGPNWSTLRTSKKEIAFQLPCVPAHARVDQLLGGIVFSIGTDWLIDIFSELFHEFRATLGTLYMTLLCEEEPFQSWFFNPFETEILKDF
jgi:hypothetical protein